MTHAHGWSCKSFPVLHDGFRLTDTYQSANSRLESDAELKAMRAGVPPGPKVVAGVTTRASTAWPCHVARLPRYARRPAVPAAHSWQRASDECTSRRRRTCCLPRRACWLAPAKRGTQAADAASCAAPLAPGAERCPRLPAPPADTDAAHASKRGRIAPRGLAPPELAPDMQQDDERDEEEAEHKHRGRPDLQARMLVRVEAKEARLRAARARGGARRPALAQRCARCGGDRGRARRGTTALWRRTGALRLRADGLWRKRRARRARRARGEGARVRCARARFSTLCAPTCGQARPRRPPPSPPPAGRHVGSRNCVRTMAAPELSVSSPAGWLRGTGLVWRIRSPGALTDTTSGGP